MDPRVAWFREVDYTHIVSQMFERGAYAKATGVYFHAKNWPGVTIMVLRWHPRLERNEGGRFN